MDDIVYTGSNSKLMNEFKADMMQRYEMTDLGLLHHFLRMRIVQSEHIIFINQKNYSLTLLENSGLNCKSVSISFAK